MTGTWEARVAETWSAAELLGHAELVARIDSLVAERPGTDGAAVFEAASARDWADREADAEPLYRRAIELGLVDPLRARAIIQLASTLRNLGRPTEAIEILQDGFADDPDHPLADAARAFLALCLADTGDTLTATAVALDALAPHLAEYTRAVRAYAGELTRRQGFSRGATG